MTKKILILLICSNIFSNEIEGDYNSPKNWWWYEDPIKKDKSKETKTNKKVDKDKVMINIAESLQELVKQNKSINEQNKKILKVLNYAFPKTTPDFTINKKTGEKCKSNSSADCFVMPVTQEGQTIPVLTKYLKQPNMKNSLEYSKWQAEYINHVGKVGESLFFVNKQYSEEAYPIDNFLSTTHPLYSTNKKKDIQSLYIEKLADNIGLYFFIGKTTSLENFYSPTFIIESTYGKLKNIKNKLYIFEDDETLAKFNEKVEESAHGYKSIKEAWKKTKKVVDKNLFIKYNIKTTPNSVLLFKDKDNNVINQKLGLFNVDSKTLISLIYRFLQFNGIIDKNSFNPDIQWNILSSETKKEKLDFIQDKIKDSNLTYEVTEKQLRREK